MNCKQKILKSYQIRTQWIQHLILIKQIELKCKRIFNNNSKQKLAIDGGEKLTVHIKNW